MAEPIVDPKTGEIAFPSQEAYEAHLREQWEIFCAALPPEERAAREAQLQEEIARREEHVSYMRHVPNGTHIALSVGALPGTPAAAFGDKFPSQYKRALEL